MNDKTDRDAQMHRSSVQLPGFIDATQLLEQACKELESGQMVHSDGFTLMDAMSAIQVLDPRMDSGMDPPLSQDAEILSKIANGTEDPPDGSGATSEFIHFRATFDLDNHPGSALTPQEACWLMDSVASREVAFHQGAPLAQTLYTCQYIHRISESDDQTSNSFMNFHSASTYNLRESLLDTSNQVYSSSENRPPKEITTLILYSYLEATLACHGLVWEELCSGNVVDGEDFIGDLAGSPILEPFLKQGGSSAAAMDNVGRALSLLEKASLWIGESTKDGLLPFPMAQALAARLQFRADLLATILSKRSLGTPEEVITRCTSNQEVLKEIYFSNPSGLSLSTSTSTSSFPSSNLQDPHSIPVSPFPPSQRLRFRNGVSVFDPSLSRRLPSPVPPREFDLPNQEQVKDFWNKALEDLKRLARAGKIAGESGDVDSWKMFLMTSACSFQIDPSCAWIRSSWQTFLYSPETGATAGYLPIEHLATSFLEFSAGVDKSSLRRLVLTQSTGSDECIDQTVGRSITGFIGRVAGQMINYLSIYSQNRSRQKRSFAKAYGALVELASQGAELGQTLGNISVPLPFHPDSIFAAIQFLTSELMTQTVFSGFELDLYRKDEWKSIYFMGIKILDEGLDVLNGLIHERKIQSKTDEKRRNSGLAWLESQAEFLGVLRNVSIGVFQMLKASPALPRPSLPLNSTNITSSTFNSRSLAKSTFQRRFKWLSIQGKPETKNNSENLWKLFEEEESIETDDEKMLKGSIQRFEEALSLIEKLKERDSEECRVQLCTIEFRQILDRIIHCCERNKETSVRLCGKQNQRIDWSFENSHPWFPIANIIE